MIKQIFITVLVTLSFLFSANKVQAQCQPNAGNDMGICGLSTTLEGELSNQSSTCQWAVLTVPNGGSATIQYETNDTTMVNASVYGLYKFTLTETNGGCTNVDTIKVEFIRMPNISAGPDQNVCGKWTQLNGIGDNESDSTWWDPAPIYWVDTLGSVIQDTISRYRLDGFVYNVSLIQQSCVDTVQFVLNQCIAGNEFNTTYCISKDTTNVMFYADIYAENQTNVQYQVCGRFIQLNSSLLLPACSTVNGYWIDSTNSVVNWWQDSLHTIVGNGENSFAEINNSGQNAFAFVLTNGNNNPVCADTSDFITVDFIFSNINGIIYNYDDIPASNMNVELFNQNNNTLLATSQIDNQGNYNFNFGETGTFMLKLNLMEPEIAIPYLSTYYTNQYLWNNSPTTISLTCGDSINTNFSALSYSSANTGSGYINGNISYLNSGNAFGGASVFLIDSLSSDIVNYTITDSSGFYQFSGVNNGSYYLNVDIFGLPQNSTHNFSISSSNLILGNLNFNVDTVIGTKTVNTAFGISANYESVGVENFEENNKFSIYPNPAQKKLQIIINNEQLNKNIEILSVEGKNIKQFEINSEQLTINISDLENGVYFIKVGDYVQKFIKE